MPPSGNRQRKETVAPFRIVNAKRLGIHLASEIRCSVRRAVSMAQKVQVLLVDDLDGSEATETVAFGLDGAAYEIDLSSGNAGKLRKELAGYVEHARRSEERRVGKEENT